MFKAVALIQAREVPGSPGNDWMWQTVGGRNEEKYLLGSLV